MNMWVCMCVYVGKYVSVRVSVRVGVCARVWCIVRTEYSEIRAFCAQGTSVAHIVAIGMVCHVVGRSGSKPNTLAKLHIKSRELSSVKNSPNVLSCTESEKSLKVVRKLTSHISSPSNFFEACALNS
jgi:hypothetical protein